MTSWEFKLTIHRFVPLFSLFLCPSSSFFFLLKQSERHQLRSVCVVHHEGLLSLLSFFLILLSYETQATLPQQQQKKKGRETDSRHSHLQRPYWRWVMRSLISGSSTLIWLKLQRRSRLISTTLRIAYMSRCSRLKSLPVRIILLFSSSFHIFSANVSHLVIRCEDIHAVDESVFDHEQKESSGALWFHVQTQPLRLTLGLWISDKKRAYQRHHNSPVRPFLFSNWRLAALNNSLRLHTRLKERMAAMRERGVTPLYSTYAHVIKMYCKYGKH